MSGLHARRPRITVDAGNERNVDRLGNLFVVTMNRTGLKQFRRAGDEAALASPFWLDRWYGRVAMIVATIVLLTFAYAPYHQFYLAWVGLVPYLLMVRRTRSAWTAFWWSWAGGTAFF